MNWQTRKVNKKLSLSLVAALILLQSSLLIKSALEDSPVSDEPVHLLSGYLILTKGDYSLNPEHPPLAKVLSALAILKNKPSLNLSSEFLKKSKDFYYDNRREGFSEAENFVYEDNDAKKLFALARLPTIIITLALTLVTYLILSAVFDEKIALFSSFFLALQPNILAHGHLVTTDVWVTLGFLLSAATLYCYANHPNLKWALLSGLSVSMANACKFSALPLWPILIFYFLYFAKKEKLKHLLVGLGVALLFLWAVYGFKVGFPQGSAGSIPSPRYFAYELKLLPLPIFSSYLKGAFLVMREGIMGRPAYLLGKVLKNGTPFYFPLAWLLKTPLIEILLVFLGIFFAIKKFQKGDYKKEEAAKFWFFFPYLVFGLFALFSKINIGIRHILPLEVPLLVIASFGLTSLTNLFKKKGNLLLVYTLSLFLLGSIKGFPNYIAYFNELVPPEQAKNLLLDSNLDWGQDLYRLEDYLKSKNLNLEPLYLGYSWHQRALDYLKINHLPIENFPGRGIVIINVGMLKRIYYPQTDLSWLNAYQPKDKIGASLYLYEIR